jgi:2-polyprenyl-6-methoxyphenol hydroxylase-like FAD-dependent oxidoreductase
LKKIALSGDGVGPPAQLHKSSRIEKVDAETATIVQSGGSTVQGDVLIGADGIHSITRLSIDPSIRPYKTHRSAFRFLITRKAALEDPTTRELASTQGSMDMWYAADRKIVMYPCADNTLLNFVCIHPAELSDAGATSGYNTTATKEQLLDIFQNFEPVLKAFLSKAEPGTIKVWPLYDMEQLPSYTRGRMALIGDAAHPFLPHLAQGGAQAIEDGVALATMLASGVEKSAVPLRLRLYNEARYSRASKIQTWTRLAGEDRVKDAQTSKADFSGNALA